jgi:hypothetical protein
VRVERRRRAEEDRGGEDEEEGEEEKCACLVSIPTTKSEADKKRFAKRICV